LEHIVITGGEPFLQEGVVDLIDELVDNQQYKVTVETNGTIFRKTKASLVSMSPKLESSTPKEESLERKLHINGTSNYSNTIQQFQDYYENRLLFKFVYNGDFKEIDKFIRLHNIKPNQVYMMPQGVTKKQLQNKQRELFHICMNKGYNYTPRLHIDILGNKRGI